MDFWVKLNLDIVILNECLGNNIRNYRNVCANKSLLIEMSSSYLRASFSYELKWVGNKANCRNEVINPLTLKRAIVSNCNH